MFAWLLGLWGGKLPATEPSRTSPSQSSVIIGNDNINSPITIGLNEEGVLEGVREVFRQELSDIARAKGVPEAPLRAVLKTLGEKRVPRSEIPARLAAAADELIRLRQDLARIRNDRPEFAAIRARASTLIDKGEFEAARAALQEGRRAARDLREEISRSLCSNRRRVGSCTQI